jgi:hypothetical protein
MGSWTHKHSHTHTHTHTWTRCHTKTEVLHWKKTSQNVKKEYKIHQVKMLQRDKMPFRDEISQFMGKIIHKTHQDKL